MTSQRYSAKYDLKNSYSKNLVPIIFMILFVVNSYILGVISSFQYVLTDLKTGENIKDYINCALCGANSASSMTFDCVCIGAIFAMTNVLFMSKPSVNFYFSAPVDRATLFKNKTIAALSTMAGILFVGVAVDSVINIYYLSNPSYILKMALALYAESLLYCFVSYIIFAVGIYACYTVIEGIIFGASIFMLPTIAAFGVNSICYAFLSGYSRNSFSSIFMSTQSTFNESSLLCATANFNPLLFGKAIGSERLSDTIFSLAYSGIESSVDGYSVDVDTVQNVKLEQTLPSINYILPLIIWAFVFVALVFVARYIFVHKKAENTSIHSSNKLATLIFTLEAGIFCSAFVISLIDSSWLNSNAALAILIMLLIFVAVYLIFNMICTRKFLLSKRTFVTGTIASVCLVVIAVVFTFGGFGYSSYIPEVDDIKMATITGVGAVEMTHNEGVDEYIIEPFGDEKTNAFAIFTDKDDLSKLCDVVKSISQKSDDSMSVSVTVVYQLNSGKKVVRHYRTCDKESMYQILSLTDTDAYKNQLEYLLLSDYSSESDFEKNLEAFGISDTDFFNNYSYLESAKEIFYDSDRVKVSHYNFDDGVNIENTAELRKALYEDLSQTTYVERYNPDEKEIAKIKFSDSIDEEKYEINFCVFRVYPSMTNTINYLKSVGAYSESTDYFETKPYSAYVTTVKNLKDNSDAYSNFNYMFYSFTCSEIDLSGYYNLSISDIYGENIITDEDKIDSLLQNAKPYYYADDDDIVVLFETKDDTNDDSAEVYCTPMIIDSAYAPAWLSK
jgi:hypothetical protein